MADISKLKQMRKYNILWTAAMVCGFVASAIDCILDKIVAMHSRKSLYSTHG